MTGAIKKDTPLDENDLRSSLPRFTPEAREANYALVDLVEKIAKKKQVSNAQIALAWVLAQAPWIVPIPGTTKIHRLAENIGALSVELTADDLKGIATALSQISVQGDRYSPAMQKTVER